MVSTCRPPDVKNPARREPAGLIVFGSLSATASDLYMGVRPIRQGGLNGNRPNLAAGLSRDRAHSK
jgi:hypothetical protein